MQPSYFKQPNIDSACTASSHNSKQQSLRSIRLHFSARDLPEPDSRSRASYAVIYHAKEALASPSHSANLLPSKSSSSAQPPHVSILSDASADSANSSSTPPPTTPTRLTPSRSSQSASPNHTTSPNHHSPQPHPNLLRQASLSVKNPQKSSALRAPHLASSYAAPDAPTEFLAPDGTPITRTAWTKLGTTEVARKNGRDLEFSTSFLFDFNPRENQLIRIIFYDSTSSNVDKQRLIATAELPVASVYSAKGKPVSFPLTFMPVTKKDVKRSAKIPPGVLVVAAQRASGRVVNYHLDVECNCIIRTKALSSAPIKRVFYAIHAILDSDHRSDHWTLLYRSDAAEMIHTKRDGGSLEYNHFSSRRLVAGPGLIIDDPDAKKNDTGGNGVAALVSKALGRKKREQFFSLPGAYLPLETDAVPLKLTLFEDCGQISGFFFIADTEFTIRDLKQTNLGVSSAIKVHANVVGKTLLKMFTSVLRV